MCKTGLGHDDAFNFVQGRRFCIAPRTEFQHQIEVSSKPFAIPRPPGCLTLMGTMPAERGRS